MLTGVLNIGVPRLSLSDVDNWSSMKFSDFFGLKDGGWRLIYRRRYIIVFFLTLVLLIRTIWYYVPVTKFTIRGNKKRLPFKYDSLVVKPAIERGTELFALLLVNSSPHAIGYSEKRQAIRDTWGNCEQLHAMYRESQYLPEDVTCKLVFYLARSNFDDRVKQEAAEHNDILLVNYTDSYMDITRKLMVTFKWASSLNPKYIVKTDDDVFVHIPRLFNGLSREAGDDFYGGIILEGSKVVRTPGHRHYITRKQYKDDYYPPYCKGAMYILSGGLIPQLLHAADFIPYMHVDDAYVGILMYYIGVTTESLNYFLHLKAAFVPFRYTLTDCVLNRVIAISDSVDAKLMYSIHERIKYTEATVWTRYLCYTDNRAVVILVCLLVIIGITIFNFLRSHRIIGFHYKQ